MFDVGNMIVLNNVNKSFSSGFFNKQIIPVIRDISFSIEKGTILGLVGPSGCGKSTLGKIIVGLIPVDKGTVSFKAKEIRSFKKKDWKEYRQNIQMVMQHPDSAFNPKLKIRNSMTEVFHFYDLCSTEDENDYLRNMLVQVQIHESLLDRYPYQLSGGEIQRLAIARALLLQPQCLVLDEVTSMLDVSIQAQIIHLLLKLHRQHTTSYLFITHDFPLAQKFCHRIVQIEDGKLGQILSAA